MMKKKKQLTWTIYEGLLVQPTSQNWHFDAWSLKYQFWKEGQINSFSALDRKFIIYKLCNISKNSFFFFFLNFFIIVYFLAILNPPIALELACPSFNFKIRLSAEKFSTWPKVNTGWQVWQVFSVCVCVIKLLKPLAEWTKRLLNDLSTKLHGRVAKYNINQLSDKFFYLY